MAAAASPQTTQHPPNVASDIEGINTEPGPEPEAESDGDPLKGWTPDVIFRIFKMMEKCDSSKRLHDDSAKFYDKRQKQLGRVVTVMAFVVTVVGSASNLFGTWYIYIYGFLGSLLTLTSGYVAQSRYQETATKHRAASQKFYELYQTVDYQLTFPKIRSSAHLFFRFINLSFGQINGRAPRPPDAVRPPTTIAPLTGIEVVGNNRDELPFLDPTGPTNPAGTSTLPTDPVDQDYTSYITNRRKEYITETD